mmetsp:Transcript_48150/g.120546  ORF Transcript_48150/g.120546 Transcript_48150/m.120546 type:complete len:333 (-) Transcript_48150:131-1129(-)
MADLHHRIQRGKERSMLVQVACESGYQRHLSLYCTLPWCVLLPMTCSTSCRSPRPNRWSGWTSLRLGSCAIGSNVASDALCVRAVGTWSSSREKSFKVAFRHFDLVFWWWRFLVFWWWCSLQPIDIDAPRLLIATHTDLVGNWSFLLLNDADCPPRQMLLALSSLLLLLAHRLTSFLVDRLKTLFYQLDGFLDVDWLCIHRDKPCRAARMHRFSAVQHLEWRESCGLMLRRTIRVQGQGNHSVPVRLLLAEIRTYPILHKVRLKRSISALACGCLGDVVVCLTGDLRARRQQTPDCAVLETLNAMTQSNRLRPSQSTSPTQICTNVGTHHTS